MRHDIISHLKALTTDPDLWTKTEAKLGLKELISNTGVLYLNRLIEY